MSEPGLEVAVELTPPDEAGAGLTVEFLGETFRLADRISSLAVNRFGKLAASGANTDDMAGLAAVYDLIRQCIADEDWARFEAHADRVRADDEQLMQVVATALEAIAQRPTRRRSTSSAGPSTTTMSSPVVSSSPVLPPAASPHGQQDAEPGSAFRPQVAAAETPRVVAGTAVGPEDPMATVHRLERAGRPDLAYVTQQAIRSRASA